MFVGLKPGRFCLAGVGDAQSGAGALAIEGQLSMDHFLASIARNTQDSAHRYRPIALTHAWFDALKAVSRFTDSDEIRSL